MKISVQNGTYAERTAGSGAVSSPGAESAAGKNRERENGNGVAVTISEEGAAAGKYMGRLDKGERVNLLEEFRKRGGDVTVLQTPEMEQMEGGGLPQLTEEEKAALLKESLKPAVKLHLIIPNIQTDTKLTNSLEGYGEEVNDAAYSIIRNNLLAHDVGGMSEEERAGMISLGLEKAQYLADRYMSGEDGALFMEAMETIAKYAANGVNDGSGKMTYYIRQGPMNGAPDDYVNSYDVMKRYDPVSYAKFNSLMQEGIRTGDMSKQLEACRFGTEWSRKSYSEHGEWYTEMADQYAGWKARMENTKLAGTFSGLDKSSGESFLNSALAKSTAANFPGEEFLMRDLEAFFKNLP